MQLAKSTLKSESTIDLYLQKYYNSITEVLSQVLISVSTFILVLIDVLVNLYTKERRIFLSRQKRTDFGKRVKHKLDDKEMLQKDLMAKVHEETGRYIDSGYMNKILTGKRTPQVIIASICHILDMPIPQPHELQLENNL